jgi:hypothetical protein
VAIFSGSSFFELPGAAVNQIAPFRGLSRSASRAGHFAKWPTICLTAANPGFFAVSKRGCKPVCTISRCKFGEANEFLEIGRTI